MFRKTEKYGMSGVLTALIVLAASVMPANAATKVTSDENTVYPAGDNAAVFVTPAFGKYPKPLLVSMTPAEIRVISNSQEQVDSLAGVNPLTARLVTWYIEPSVQILQRSNLLADH